MCPSEYPLVSCHCQSILRRCSARAPSQLSCSIYVATENLPSSRFLGDPSCPGNISAHVRHWDSTLVGKLLVLVIIIKPGNNPPSQKRWGSMLHREYGRAEQLCDWGRRIRSHVGFMIGRNKPTWVRLSFSSPSGCTIVSYVLINHQHQPNLSISYLFSHRSSVSTQLVGGDPID